MLCAQLPLRGLAAVLALVTPLLGQDYALELGPGGRVVFPHDPIMNTGEAVTIEAWVQASPSATGFFRPFERYQGSVEHKGIRVESTGEIDFIYAGSPWQHGSHPQPPEAFPRDGRWHHVAFVRHSDGTYEFYVDGQPLVEGGPGPCWSTCAIINGSPETHVAITDGSGWRIDDLRVSTVDRYSGPFLPPVDYPADSHSALLLHFDEGVGAVVSDAGVALQAGTIEGPYAWVPRHDEIVSYCFATGTSCPCGNDSGGTAGCTTSAGTGAGLSFQGSTSVQLDDLVLTASPLPVNVAGLFYMGGGDTQAPLGDGLQCVGAGPLTTFRFPPGNSGPGGSLSLGPVVSSSNGLIAPGQTWMLQVWFRDPLGPCGAGSNLSSAIAVTFCP